MRENINKVSQRGERLDSLQDKTDNLATSAQGFRRGANRVRKQVSPMSSRINEKAAMSQPKILTRIAVRCGGRT